MASANAFRLMEGEKWDAVKEMLSEGQLSTADLEQHHGVRYLFFICVSTLERNIDDWYAAHTLYPM